MTNCHAKFIAERVPGAKVRGPSPNCWVAADRRHWGVRCDTYAVLWLHVTCDGMTVDVGAMASITDAVSMFSSAIAAATAAGFPEGKQGEGQSK